MAERQVPAFDNALSANGTASSWPEPNKRKFEEVEQDVAPRQAKLPRHGQRDEDSAPGNASWSDWQGQIPIETFVQHNGAPNIAPHEISPGRCTSQEEQACRAAVTEPGSQTPGVVVNGMYPR